MSQAYERYLFDAFDAYFYLGAGFCAGPRFCIEVRCSKPVECWRRSYELAIRMDLLVKGVF